MKNTCQTVDAFLMNLRIELERFIKRWEAEGEPVHPEGIFPVHRKSIWVDVEEKGTETVFSIAVHVTALVSNEEGEYLLEACEYCGKDYRDASQELEGSENKQTLVERIGEFCKMYGLTIRPGVISP